VTTGGSAALVELKIDGHVAVITLANPERRNVLDLPMARALRGAAEHAGAAADVRCVVITGSGNTFAAGADIAELEAASAADNLAYNAQLLEAVDAVAAIPVPTIAAVNGHAIGGGLELACACVLRVVSVKAKLGLPEVRLGIVPATGGLVRLPRLISPTVAARLLLTGDLISGTEAVELGLANAAAETEQVLPEALALAERIAAAAPLSARAIVESLRSDGGLPIAEANRRVEERLAGVLESADRREGARAFLERRDPVFKGS
jgi:enoyl-CoA hydratase/carnithine racemase